MKAWHVIVIIVVILLLFVGFTYNSFIKKQLDVENSWAEIDNQYKRRSDLIPNLVNTVKGYAAHEKETFTEVIEARSKATSINVDPKNLNPQVLEQFHEAQAGLTQALSKLMVVVERYPDLKANQNFLDLQSQLGKIEEEIQLARRYYNGTVRELNIKIESFPSNLVAGFFRFTPAEFFEIEDKADQAVPKVTFPQ